jgi:C4-dicarboxylate-specific signal transduction histidine kinase
VLRKASSFFKRFRKPEQKIPKDFFDLESVLKGSQSGVWLWDLQEKVMRSDLVRPLLEPKPFEEAISGPHEEMRTWLRLIHPDDRERVLQFLMGFFSKEYLENQIEFRLRKKPKEYYWTLCRAILKLDSRGRPHRLFGFVSDISEQRELRQILEKQRLQKIEQERLSTLGQMAGCVAHEMNNPLAIIAGRAEQLLDGIRKESLSTEEMIKSLESIQRTSHRMARTVKSLLWFSRDPHGEELAISKWREVWDEVLGICAEKFQRGGIRLDFEEQRNEKDFEANTAQLGQVLMNLLNNAYDSIAGQALSWVRVSVYDEGADVVLRFEDSGPPIPKEIVDHMMEPFFTTKEAGRGTGLGLSICKRIIDQHGGSFRILPDAKHPCFEIRIPQLTDSGSPSDDKE